MNPRILPDLTTHWAHIEAYQAPLLRPSAQDHTATAGGEAIHEDLQLLCALQAIGEELHGALRTVAVAQGQRLQAAVMRCLHRQITKASGSSISSTASSPATTRKRLSKS